MVKVKMKVCAPEAVEMETLPLSVVEAVSPTITNIVREDGYTIVTFEDINGSHEMQIPDGHTPEIVGSVTNGVFSISVDGVPI